MFKILRQTSPLTRHSRQNSLGSDATTVSSSDSESASAFEEFILHNQNTWLNNVEELCFDYLRNKDKQRQVVLDRQSITYQQSSYLLKMVPKNLKDIEGLFHFKLETVFQDLANKYTTTEPKPRSDITEGFNFRPHGHPHDNLASKGFSKEELTSMSLADAIVYDASTSLGVATTIDTTIAIPTTTTLAITTIVVATSTTFDMCNYYCYDHFCDYNCYCQCCC